MKKIIIRYLIVLVFCFVAVLGADAFAMTVDSSKNVQAGDPSTKAVKSDVVYLLSWQDNKMVTSKGTFYLSTDITVINKSGLEPEDITLQKNPPIVQIDKAGRQIRTITILPNTQ